MRFWAAVSVWIDTGAETAVTPLPDVAVTVTEYVPTAEGVKVAMALPFWAMAAVGEDEKVYVA